VPGRRSPKLSHPGLDSSTACRAFLVGHGLVRSRRLLIASGLGLVSVGLLARDDGLIKGLPPGGGVQGGPAPFHRACFQFTQHFRGVGGPVGLRLGQAAQHQQVQIGTDRARDIRPTKERVGLRGGVALTGPALLKSRSVFFVIGLADGDFTFPWIAVNAPVAPG